MSSPVQPVNPAVPTTPYPPNQVMLPFQPPVTYQNGQFNNGDTLLQLLQSGVPAVAIEAATIAGNVADNPPDDVAITVFSKTYVPQGEINDYLGLTFQFARNRAGSAEFILKGNDPLVPTLLNCPQTMVPITIETGTSRWSGRVLTCEDKLGKFGDSPRPVNYVVVTCVSDYSMLDHILCWPNFLMPLEVQFPSEALYIGPVVTCVKTLIAEQSFRLQSGIWSFINDLGSFNIGSAINDLETWANKLLGGGGNLLEMLLTPIVVVPTNPIFDTSPWVSFSGRMDTCATLIDQVCKDTGTNVTVTLWLPGDPQPAGMLIPLTVPTYVVDAKDNLNVTGPTGTFLDGILQDTVDLQSSVLGQTLSPFLNPNNNYAPQGINIAPTVGVNFVQPWVVLTDDPRGGLLEYSVKGRTPLCYTVVAGGKSPQWINNLLNILASWAIDAITTAIGITGIPSDLFNATIDDVILAFWQANNAYRQNAMGPYGWPEYFCQTGSSAYTLDSWFAMQAAMWDTAGRYAYQWTFYNGYPYTIGVDIFVGQMASFASRGQLYTDFVDSVVYTDNRTDRVGKLEVTVGDGTFVENPVAKLYRKLVSFEKAFQIITLSTN